MVFTYQYFLNNKYFQCLQIADTINITGIFFYRYLCTNLMIFHRTDFQIESLVIKLNAE